MASFCLYSQSKDNHKNTLKGNSLSFLLLCPSPSSLSLLLLILFPFLLYFLFLIFGFKTSIEFFCLVTSRFRTPQIGTLFPQKTLNAFQLHIIKILKLILNMCLIFLKFLLNTCIFMRKKEIDTIFSSSSLSLMKNISYSSTIL